MKKRAKIFIARGLVFLCCIILAFSLSCSRKTAVVSLSSGAEQLEHRDEVQDILQEARALQWKGEYAEAYDYYDYAVRISPRDASLYFERGNLSFLILASIIADSSSADDREKLSASESERSWFVKHHCAMALDDFNKAISLEPHIDVFYYMRGSVQLFEAYPCYNAAAAIESFDKAIQLNDSNAIYYMERGKARVSLGNYKQAVDDLRQAAAIKGNDYQFYRDIGKLYEKMGMKKEAIPLYKQAMEQAPYDRLGILNRSLVVLRGDNQEELIQDYAELIAKRPEVAQLYAMRGHCYRKIGKFSEAVRDYSVVIGLQPDNKEIYVERGILLDRLGRQQQGRQDFQTACKLGNKKACSALHKGTLEVARNVTMGTLADTDISTKAESLQSTNLPEDTRVRTEVVLPKGTMTVEETKETKAEPYLRSDDTKSKVAAMEELKEARPAISASDTEDDKAAPHPDLLDEWVPFWYSANDHTWYFYNVIKKTGEENIVRVRMEQNGSSPEIDKEALPDRKINQSRPYIMELWSFDCSIPHIRMMGRYSSDSQVVSSRSPYTIARQGAFPASPREMLNELWKFVCGDKKETVTSSVP